MQPKNKDDSPDSQVYVIKPRANSYPRPSVLVSIGRSRTPVDLAVPKKSGELPQFLPRPSFDRLCSPRSASCANSNCSAPVKLASTKRCGGPAQLPLPLPVAGRAPPMAASAELLSTSFCLYNSLYNITLYQLFHCDTGGDWIVVSSTSFLYSKYRYQTSKCSRTLACAGPRSIGRLSGSSSARPSCAMDTIRASQAVS